jgi:hypothetical protein
MEALLSEACIQVSPKLAQNLSKAVADLPDYEYFSLCDDLEAQKKIYQSIYALFPSEFDTLIAEIQLCLNRRPYIAWLKGLDIDDRALVMILVSLALGQITRPAGTNAKAQIFNSTEQVVIKLTHTLDWLHTDSTNWLNPNDLTILCCLQPDQFGGGQSIILDVDSIHAEIKQHKTMNRILTTSQFPWFVTIGDDVKTIYDFILNERNELRWYRKNIDVAVRLGEGKISKEEREVVVKFENLVENSKQQLVFGLENNDILIMNNRKCLHGRTEVKYVSQTERKVIRTRVRQ